MSPLLLALIVLAALLACAFGFVVWAATSDGKEARVYRRRWKEFRMRQRKRDTQKYAGTKEAGFGASANDKRVG
ncbi:hypothetical protein M885DRAFT_553101 [Pelagophyceae sp. CCMP2097]|nr:hypothetical protein M885DRAFT_553101 [Pelagophyceae sp. CCMP2097]